MRGDKYNFDGEMLTQSEIAKRMKGSKLCLSTVRRYLSEGRNTTQKMMAVEPKWAIRAGARRGARATTNGQLQKRDLGK